MASLERQALYRGGRQLSLVLFVDRAEVSLRGNMEALPCIDAGIGLALNEMADVVQQGGDNASEARFETARLAVWSACSS